MKTVLVIKKYITHNRMLLVKVLTIVGLLSSVLVSFHLWISPRLYPLIPLFPGLSLSSSYNNLLFILFLLSLLLSLLRPHSIKVTITSLLCIVIFALYDQTRWQPWFFQYFWMLLIFLVYLWKRKKDETSISNIYRLLIVSIYIWSGIQKINPNFFSYTFPFILSPFSSYLHPSIMAYLYKIGYIVPFIEISIGVGLITQRFRSFSILVAISMHCFILFALGPLGQNYNSVVWPWNIAMIAFVIILFFHTPKITSKEIVYNKFSLFHKIVFIFFLVLPAFSLVNLYDSYLSSALYTGNTTHGVVYMNHSLAERLPTSLKRYIMKHSEDEQIEISYWSLHSLNVPPYPEERTLLTVGLSLCRYIKPGDKLQVGIYTRNYLFFKTIKEAHYYTCK